MKTRSLLVALLFLSLTCLRAQTNASAPTLVGIVGLTEQKCALLNVPAQRPAPARCLILREGERQGDIEVLRINSDAGTVEVRVAQTNLVLALGTDAGDASARAPGIVLTNAALDPVLTLYADCAGRTLLRWPTLPACSFQIRAAPANRAEAAAVFEKALEAQGIAAIPDGENFLWLVPKSQTIRPKTHSTESRWPLVGEDHGVPPGYMNLISATGDQVLQIYASIVGRKYEWDRSAPSTGGPFAFRNQTALTREELLYAMDVLLEWRGVRAVPAGDDGIKLVPVSAR